MRQAIQQCRLKFFALLCSLRSSGDVAAARIFKCDCNQVEQCMKSSVGQLSTSNGNASHTLPSETDRREEGPGFVLRLRTRHCGFFQPALNLNDLVRPAGVHDVIGAIVDGNAWD